MLFTFILLLVCGISRAELDLPKDFIFGTATSAFQVEGGWNANGKSPSNWDVRTHENPSKIKDKSTGDIACDSYHKYKEDVQLLRDLGVDSYRFSIAWTRLVPEGFGHKINPDGVRYYDALIDELIHNNITPMVTLYHWDHPQNLTHLGGWTNSLMADYFVEYADIAFKYFGDRVKMWSTFNEVHSFCVSESFNDNNVAHYLCTHNVLRAHGKTYTLYKTKYAHQKGMLGIVLDSQFYYPLTNSSTDVEAAQRATMYDINWFAHPIFSRTGDYPKFLKEHVANISKAENFTTSKLPSFTPEEIKEIQGSADYLGFNHYRAHLTSIGTAKPTDPPSLAKDVNTALTCEKSWRVTDNGWCEYSRAFYDALMHIQDEYDQPLVYITENGVADNNFNDVARINYYENYLQAVSDAIKDGANIAGYYAWSLMDNFEWMDGYSTKFGLYHVDFNDPNRTRTPKPSAFWYKDLIENHKKLRRSL